jgi:hypothetical protein
VAVREGDDYARSATWEIARGGEAARLLDFEGQTGGLDGPLPLERAYGCEVRGHSEIGLYFGRRPNEKRPRGSFNQELNASLAALERL